MKKRQRIRKALIYLSLLLFPITLNYFSPVLIIAGASKGIMNGSFVIFSLMFLFSFFFGRAWCGWLCPGAGLMELLFDVNDKPARGGRFDLIKWFLVWIPWLAAIGFFVFKAGGYKKIDFFFMSEKVVSVDEPAKFFIYFIVVFTFVIISLLAGKRAGCHYICWMSPFMITGTYLGKLAGIPSLRLKASKEKCKNCLKCSQNCPMSLDVNGHVNSGLMYDPECVLCCSCVDNCPEGAIKLTVNS